MFMQNIRKFLHWIFISLNHLLIIPPIESCTAFQLQTKDETSIYCRSLQSESFLDSNLLIVPRGVEFIGTAPDKAPGLKWKTNYGYVGMNQSSNRLIVYDGMNEKGLVASALFFPGYADYEKSNVVTLYKTIGAWEVVSYLLGTCANVEESLKALANVVVSQEPYEDTEITLPLHYYLTDTMGRTVVVEYINGKRKEYDNSLGVLTNSPPFDWQLMNFSHFDEYLKKEVPKSLLSRISVDHSSSSRFVQAALYSRWLSPSKTVEDSVRNGFYLLNLFDFFDVKEPSQAAKKSNSLSKEKKDVHSGISEWMIVHDNINLKTYFRGYQSLAVQMVDLNKAEFNQSRLREVKMKKGLSIENDTYKGREF